MIFMTVEPVEVRVEVLLGLRDFLGPLRIEGGPGHHRGVQKGRLGVRRLGKGAVERGDLEGTEEKSQLLDGAAERSPRVSQVRTEAERHLVRRRGDLTSRLRGGSLLRGPQRALCSRPPRGTP